MVVARVDICLQTSICLASRQQENLPTVTSTPWASPSTRLSRADTPGTQHRHRQGSQPETRESFRALPTWLLNLSLCSSRQRHLGVPSVLPWQKSSSQSLRASRTYARLA